MFATFGADLLPRDHYCGANPGHRMDGVVGWVAWAPYMEMALTRKDRTEIDPALARSWQIGVAGDGLLQHTSDRNPRV